MQSWVSQQVRFLEPNQDFSARGIQTRSFGAGWANFVLEFFKMFHLYTGGPILITPECQFWEKGIYITFKMDETWEFQWLGHSNWTKCKHISQKISKNFQSSRPLYWGLPFLITPGWRKGKMQKVVSHPSTNRAKHCLTSVTGRELVLPSGYGLCLEKRIKTGRQEMQSWESWFSHISGFLKKIRISVPGAFKLDHLQ